MNPTLLINFTDGIRDASPNNLPLTHSGVSLAPGQFGLGGDFTHGTITTPPIGLSENFTLELWIAAGSAGILCNFGSTTRRALCPVPCGVARPLNSSWPSPGYTACICINPRRIAIPIREEGEEEEDWDDWDDWQPPEDDWDDWDDWQPPEDDWDDWDDWQPPEDD